MNKKVSATLLIVVAGVLAFGAAGYYIMKSKPSDTIVAVGNSLCKRSSYSNSTNGFSVDYYPEAWGEPTQDPQTKEVLFGKNSSPAFNEDDYGQYLIENAGIDYFNIWVASKTYWDSTYPGGKVGGQNGENITIAGKPAQKWVSTRNIESYRHSTAVEYSGPTKPYINTLYLIEKDQQS